LGTGTNSETTPRINNTRPTAKRIFMASPGGVVAAMNGL
jgi:hypothetical protein